MPRRAPLPRAPPTATNPTVMEIRAPERTRLKTSRPKAYVPKRWWAEGGLRRPRRFSWSTPSGAMTGAHTATSVKKRMSASPTRALALRQKRRAAMRIPEGAGRPLAGCGRGAASLDVADAGIEEGIEDVHAEVH